MCDLDKPLLHILHRQHFYMTEGLWKAGIMRKLTQVNSRRIILGEVAICLLLFFVYFIRRTGGITATSAAPQEGKKIAITFDDGPHPQFTEQLLDGLKERGVHATFFVTGEHAEQHKDIIRRMSEEGHIIGNHTYSHIQLTAGNRETFKQELIKTNKILTDITGKEVLYVRPPYGTWDKTFEKELSMFPVLWNVDPLDWCSNDTSCVINRVLKNTEENDIILMHDYYETSVNAALQIVDELQKRGYVFVTVEEILFD